MSQLNLVEDQVKGMAFGQVFQSHVMSDLLTIREKGILVRLLEPHCEVSLVFCLLDKVRFIKYGL